MGKGKVGANKRSDGDVKRNDRIVGENPICMDLKRASVLFRSHQAIVGICKYSTVF